LFGEYALQTTACRTVYRPCTQFTQNYCPAPPPAAKPASPLGDYTFYPRSASQYKRRDISQTPSLQHTHDDLPVLSPSSSRRSRSTRQDSEPEPEPFRVPSVLWKLGSKYSLLNLFRKGGYVVIREFPGVVSPAFGGFYIISPAVSMQMGGIGTQLLTKGGASGVA
jgi:hypothetical protein